MEYQGICCLVNIEIYKFIIAFGKNFTRLNCEPVINSKEWKLNEFVDISNNM